MCLYSFKVSEAMWQAVWQERSARFYDPKQLTATAQQLEEAAVTLSQLNSSPKK